jgi:hypothetical protein
MITIRIIQWIGGLAGLIALALGVFFWITNNDNITNVHMLFGLTVALALLIVSILAVTTSGMRSLGIVGIVYALILPAFGLTQSGLLIGNLHWLIQTAHMLVGLGGIALMGIIGTRYMRVKQIRIATSQ